MNPELTTTLAAQRSREMTTQAAGHRALARQARPRRPGRRLASPTASPGPGSGWP